MIDWSKFFASQLDVIDGMMYHVPQRIMKVGGQTVHPLHALGYVEPPPFMPNVSGGLGTNTPNAGALVLPPMLQQ
jgi:hypothetical protein